MRYEPLPKEFFIKNRKKLTELLKANSLVILHSNDVMPTNADGVMSFQQNTDLIYLSGIDQEESVLVLFPDAVNPADREMLFVTETNEHIAIWEGQKLTKSAARERSGVTSVYWTSNFDAKLHEVLQQAETVYFHANEHLRAENTVQTRNARYLEKFKSLYPLHKLERLAPLTHLLRSVKQAEEIQMMQRACDITEMGFRRVLRKVEPGIGEWEIEAEFAFEFLRNKSRGFAYLPIIGSGENANVLHYIDNNQICKDGDLILMDVGAEYGNWNADMTRTIPVNGTFSPRQRAVYDAVLRVLRFANTILRPGIYMKDYQCQVLDFMEKELIALGLIDEEEAKLQDASKPLVRKYFMHGTSHHLGLDVHDVSPVNEPVKVGHVYTIEPGIYIREEGIGIRLENNIWIGEEKNTDLMASIPIEADEIEALMQK